MARQKSIIKLQGTIDDISFVKTKDGYMAGKGISVNSARIASDPAFQRTRVNNSEFGRAGSASELLRTAFCLGQLIIKAWNILINLSELSYSRFL